MTEVNREAMIRLGWFVVSVSAFVFLPAWSVRYWQGWLFLGVLGGASLAITAYLMKSDPKLLEKRLRAGPRAEKERSQKIILTLASLSFVALIVGPAVDHRAGWSRVPVWAVWAGDGLVVAGYVMIFFVFRENSFTSSTVEIQEGQTVVSTGPYARVRHPMYAGALVMIAGVPVALGSWWGLLLVIPLVASLVLRLLEEEKFLVERLAGYAEYRQNVRWRLVPGIW